MPLSFRHASRGTRILHSANCVRALSTRPVIGIRREDPQRLWERRSPLTPEAVERLVNEDGFSVLVQPCERRVFKTDDFVQAGAAVHPTLDPAHVLLGIKETPLNELITSPVPADGVPRTHLMFSHTHKGQEYNMELLSRFLAGSSPEASRLLPTLIDWELLTDESGKRTVGFGWYAGVAGALEGLISTAHLHLSLGVASPFLSTPRPHTAPLPQLLKSLKQVGDIISREGTPQSMGPFVVVVTGSGQVSTGALSLLRESLPTEEIKVEDLPRLIKDPTAALNRVYLLHATQETYLFHKDTGERASRADYYADPLAYESRFHKLIAPYTTLLINGVGWTTSSPRLMTIEQTIEALVEVQKVRQELLQTRDDGSLHPRDVMKGRCQSFADISCDIGGGLGFLPHSSTLSTPFFSLDLRSAFPTLCPPDIKLPFLQVMAVDILPTALPLEASESFCEGILPYVRSVATKYAKGKSKLVDEAEIRQALDRATIASGGLLREKHQWLQDSVRKIQSQRSESSLEHGCAHQTIRPPRRKSVLLLGAGMVAGPTIEEISLRTDVDLVIASDQEARNLELIRGNPNATSVVLDVTNRDALSDLVRAADVVISLLPVPFHPAVAELCIKHKRHLVTASYISPSMRALDYQARDANVMLLNEIGLDPGIDHCSALSLIARLRAQGKKIVSFTSFCGGLPSPDCADVPLKYRFSWSPRGVLNAALNGARFLVNDKTTDVTGENLLTSYISDVPVSGLLRLEGLPNRDSLSYSDTYDLQPKDGLRTLFRGTLRYPGFSQLLWSFKQLGLLDVGRELQIGSYSDLIRLSMEDVTKTSLTNRASLLSALTELVPDCDATGLLDSIEWLSQVKGPAPPQHPIPAIDLFTTLLASKLAYEPQQRDVVVLHHEIITTKEDGTGSLEEAHTAALEVYGNECHSAMALCVGLPIAIAALQVLDGKVASAGVQGPTSPLVYEHILEIMQARGVGLKETSKMYHDNAGIEAKLQKYWA